MKWKPWSDTINNVCADYGIIENNDNNTVFIEAYHLFLRSEETDCYMPTLCEELKRAEQYLCKDIEEEVRNEVFWKSLSMNRKKIGFLYVSLHRTM